MAMSPRRASCLCGALTVDANGEPERVYLCHCPACQRRTGSAFGVLARFAKEQVSVAGSARAFVRQGDSGDTVTQNFCPQCGATVYAYLQGSPDAVIVPVGAFADQDFPAPTFSIYERHMQTWCTLPPHLDHHD